MSLEITGPVTGQVAGRDIIHGHPGVDCTLLRTGLVLAALGALGWWWLKTRPAAPEPPPGPLKKAG